MTRPLPRALPWRRACSVGFGLAIWGAFATPALAICPSDGLAVLCNPAVMGDGPRLTQADVDNGSAILTDSPWVLDGTTIVRLPAGGDYTPGVPPGLGSPTIFVTEDAALVLEDLGAAGVDLDANIVLCDSGALEVRDSELRFDSTSALTFALEDSEVFLAGATISGPGAGPVTQVFSDTATLTAIPTTLPSVRSGSGSIHWALSGASTANITDAQVFATLGVGASASVNLTDSSYMEMLMESCETDTLAIDALPDACDVGVDCFGEDHPLTNFSRPAPYAMQIVDSQVFGWSALNHPGSTTTVSDVPANANLAVELTGDFGISALTFPPGEAPEGLSDRTIDVSTSEILAWSVSASGTSELSIGAGSELGGLTCSGDAICSVVDTTFVEGASVENGEQALMTVEASTVGGDVLNAGAGLQIVSSALAGNLTMAAPTWVADTSYIATTTVDDGVFHLVDLSTPVDETAVDPGAPIEIRGDVYALDAAGTVVPFPTAIVEIEDLSDGETTLLATVEASAQDVLFHTWDTSGVAPGDYEVSLRFEPSDVAVARRRVTINPEGSETATDDGSGSGSTSGSDDGGDTTTTGADESTTASDDGTTADPTSDSASDSASGTTTGPAPATMSDTAMPSGADTGEGSDTDSAGETASAGGCQVGSRGPLSSAWSLAWIMFGLGFARRRRACGSI